MSLNFLSLKTSDVYLNASSGKLFANVSRLELINWKLSRKIIGLPNTKAMYFSLLFGIAHIRVFWQVHQSLAS